MRLEFSIVLSPSSYYLGYFLNFLRSSSFLQDITRYNIADRSLHDVLYSVRSSSRDCDVCYRRERKLLITLWYTLNLPCVFIQGEVGTGKLPSKTWIYIYIRGQVVNYSQYPHTWGGGGGGYPSLTHCHGGDREKEINREKVGRYNFLMKYKKIYRSGVLYKYKKKVEPGSVNGYVRTYICTYIHNNFFNSRGGWWWSTGRVGGIRISMDIKQKMIKDVPTRCGCKWRKKGWKTQINRLRNKYRRVKKERKRSRRG